MDSLPTQSEQIERDVSVVSHSIASSPLGFTLVEVMIGLILFSIMSLGLTASLIQSLKISDQVLSRSTANSVALGYAEQLMANSYTDLKEALLLGTEFSLVSASLGDSSGSAVEEVFSFGVEKEQSIVMDIDRESGAVTRTMPMRFTIEALNLNTGADALSALEITINYSYIRSALSQSADATWSTGTINIVKSLVDIY
jgi:prepilin-type N-terminal cleavage/methylation domain-containing protein